MYMCGPNAIGPVECRRQGVAVGGRLGPQALMPSIAAAPALLSDHDGLLPTISQLVAQLRAMKSSELPAGAARSA
jgi:hypothetical protein